RRFGGAVGAGSRFELRGPSSVAFRGQPLLVIDGIRAISEEEVLSVDLGSTTVSSYDDLDPEMIESVTVLPGPAAAARYGPAAANGVLEVRTRRGPEWHTRWRAFAEAGLRADPGGYPANFQQIGRGPGGERVANCDLVFQSVGGCTPVADSLLSYNPLEQSSPFRTGTRLGTGVSVEGGNGVLTYAAGAGIERGEGVLENNDEERVSLRASLGVRPISSVEVRVWAAHLRRELALPIEGNNPLGVITAGLLGGADPRINEGFASFFPSDRDFLDAGQDTRRTLAGVEASWAALEWLRLGGRFGIDRAERDELSLLSVDPNAVFRQSADRESQVRTGAVEAEARFRLSPSMESRTTLEVERVSERAEVKTFSGREDGTGGFSEFESRARRAVLGVSLRQGIDAGPLSVDAAVRRDEPRDQAELWSGSVGAAWTLGAPAPWLEGLTLRGAWGRTERSPNSVVGVEGPFFLFPPLCAGATCEPLQPQESREVEAGVDVRVLGRVDVRLTGYRRDDVDVLVLEPGPEPFRSGTEVRNTGAELSLRARLLERGRTAWDVEVLGWANRNRVTARPDGTIPVISGSTGQRIEEGRPLGGYFAHPLVDFDDLDDDGIIDLSGCPSGPACELELGDTAVYLGSPNPTHGLTLASRLRLSDRVTVSARVEHQGGARLLNRIGALRCTSSFTCREAVDPSTSLEDQARAGAAILGTLGGFVEDADFVKLREVAVTLTAPRAWSRAIGAWGIDLTVAGRNLLTWSPYSGPDPEINTFSSSPFEVWDFASQPLPRTVTTRVEVHF
ncbi:MAG TPA: TonB-dependent receptor, partial [Longimicrobium sp.]|nr:TonB-dependent receptor [Longimicrobium sp.]